VHPTHKWIWIEPDPKYQQNEWHQGGEFPLAEVPELREVVRVWDPEHHTLEHPEKIRGGENDAQ
jgi:hypothetical protein